VALGRGRSDGEEKDSTARGEEAVNVVSGEEPLATVDALEENPAHVNSISYVLYDMLYCIRYIV
jgi:hypothetical protein